MNWFVFVLSILLFSTSCNQVDSIDNQEPDSETEIESQLENINLNLRVHLMQSEPWVHPTGTEMSSWVTPSDIENIVIPELNRIWEQARITWNIESIIEEEIFKYDGYESSIEFIINTKRDEDGRSDPNRLPPLYYLMQPKHRSSASELNSNLYHIYLFPFIGNTSQGNAMRNFGYHSVVGVWTNKFNYGGIPEKTYLKEDPNNFVRGSLSRTISHELGHVLQLRHTCNPCLMGSKGYNVLSEQIDISRAEALRRY